MNSLRVVALVLPFSSYSLHLPLSTPFLILPSLARYAFPFSSLLIQSTCNKDFAVCHASSYSVLRGEHALLNFHICGHIPLYLPYTFLSLFFPSLFPYIPSFHLTSVLLSVSAMQTSLSNYKLVPHQIPPKEIPNIEKACNEKKVQGEGKKGWGGGGGWSLVEEGVSG